MRAALRDLARRAQAVIERFLEQREAREIRVREVNAADRRARAASAGAPRRADARADHAVAPERDLDVIDVVADVGVRAREIGEDGLGPLGVAGAGELLADADARRRR